MKANTSLIILVLISITASAQDKVVVVPPGGEYSDHDGVVANSDIENEQDKNPALHGNFYFLLLKNNKDCNGDRHGTAYLDNCNVCVGGKTGLIPCTQDCNGDWEGTATTNSCGCVGGNTGVDNTVSCVTSAGQVWMDRNLGASRVATSMTDTEAYGDLYQWGRLSDGHEKRTSSTIMALSSSDVPGHGSFITMYLPPYDWLSEQNGNLWQGGSGINNPCPSGFRLPTDVELDTERLSWSSNDYNGAFASPLKLVPAGFRHYIDGTLLGAGSYGYYWSSTVEDSYSRDLFFISGLADMESNFRAFGFSVRCIKD